MHIKRKTHTKKKNYQKTTARLRKNQVLSIEKIFAMTAIVLIDTHTLELANKTIELGYLQFYLHIYTYTHDPIDAPDLRFFCLIK